MDHSSLASAEKIFSPLNVQVVASHRFLGGFLGDASASSSFVQDRVDCWVSDGRHLSQMAVP